MSTISDVKGAPTKSAGVQIGSTGKQRPGDCENEDIRCGSPAMCCRRSSSHSTMVAPPSRPTSTAASSGDMFTALSTPIGIAAVVDDDFAPLGQIDFGSHPRCSTRRSGRRARRAEAPRDVVPLHASVRKTPVSCPSRCVAVDSWSPLVYVCRHT